MERHINYPVQVICSCSTSGEFTPIRFRFESPSCELITIDILAVESRKSVHMNNAYEMTYVCKGKLNNLIKTFHLRYSITAHK